MSDKNNESKDTKGYDELCNALNATFDALDKTMLHILESLGFCYDEGDETEDDQQIGRAS